MFLISIGFLFLIAFISAVFSLKMEYSKPVEIENTKKSLKKEKILYRSK